MKLFKAFTLVELLVVMAIISFLSVGAFAGLSFGLRQARDVQKKKIVDLAQTALQAYYSDYATYPKCGSTGSGTGSLAVTAAGGSQWYYCADAFPKTSSTGTVTPGNLIIGGGKTGIKDYLEGEWPTSNANAQAGESDKYIRYYYSPGSSSGPALKFAVCITMENKTSSSNIKNISTNVNDCYCAGTEYSEVACKGLESR